MKDIKIDKEIENIVEAIFLHASALGEYKIKYKEAVFAALKQFQLDNYYDNNFVLEDFENLKLRLYGLVIKNLNEYNAREKKKKM